MSEARHFRFRHVVWLAAKTSICSGASNAAKCHAVCLAFVVVVMPLHPVPVSFPKLAWAAWQVLKKEPFSLP